MNYSIIEPNAVFPPYTCSSELSVWTIAWEDLLEKGMATHFSLLAWKIPWTEEPGRPQSMELQRARQDKATKYAYMQLI